MESIIRFRTDHLIAERLRIEDLDELCRMHQDPRVMATLGGLRCDEQTQQFLRDNLMHWDRYGYGLWMFRAQADGGFVGRGGLRNVHVGGHDEVEVAYALLAAFWGRGQGDLDRRLRAAWYGGHHGLHIGDQPGVTASYGEGRLPVRARHCPRRSPPRALPNKTRGVN